MLLIMDWRSPDRIQLPPPHTAHIWRLRTRINDEECQHWYGMLSDPEKKQADAKNPKRRQEYIATRGQLRFLLSAYLDIPAESIELVANDHGKPLLARHRYPHELEFNLSHSGSCALLAFACNTPVGIDLETIRPKPFLEIAHRFFHEQEYRYLCSRDETQGLRDFFRYWTIKEAVLKAMGTGLQYGLDKIVLEEPGSSQAVYRLHLQSAPCTSWEIHRFNVTEEILAALALSGTGWTLEFFRYGAS